MNAAVRGLQTLFEVGSLGGLSDGQLLDRFLARREGAVFEALIHRHGLMVWGVCRRVLHDYHDAEDAFQATFLVLARKASTVMPREKLGNWLYGVAFQTAMNAMATRAKRRVRECSAKAITEPAAVSDEHADELLSRLDREVARLPEKYRIPIILCELEGNTHRQAAERLGWPVGTVSGRLSRARTLLADRLSRTGTPLTAGALAVLLAHDSARAGVPLELLRSTAQAVSLSSVGTAVTAGVVSAEVAALAGKVVKAMLINKLTLTTAMLLMVVGLALSGTNLALRAGTTEPRDLTNDAQELQEQPNSTEASNDEQPNSIASAAKENIRQPRAPERLAGGHTKLSPFAQSLQLAPQPSLSYCDYSFTATPTGNRALAYQLSTRELKAIRLNATLEQPLRVTPVRMETQDLYCMSLRVEGPKITRLALFDLTLGKWFPLDLNEPVSGVVQPMSIGPHTVAYEIGDFLYMFSAKDHTWNRLDLRTISDEGPEIKGG
jgi:RNA polymerase sigma factor (sigma-70 family)